MGTPNGFPTPSPDGALAPKFFYSQAPHSLCPPCLQRRVGGVGVVGGVQSVLIFIPLSLRRKLG